MSNNLVKPLKNAAKKYWRCTARNIREHRSIKEAELLKIRPITGCNVWYEPSYDKANNCMFVENLFVQDVKTGDRKQFQFDVGYLDQFKYKNLWELVQDTKNAFK